MVYVYKKFISGYIRQLNKHSDSPPIFPLYNLTRTKLMRDDEMILYYRLSCLYEITSQDSVFCIQIFRLLFVGLDSFLHVLPSLLAKSSRHISNRLRSSLVNLKDSISVISEYDCLTTYTIGLLSSK